MGFNLGFKGLNKVEFFVRCGLRKFQWKPSLFRERERDCVYVGLWFGLFKAVFLWN